MLNFSKSVSIKINLGWPESEYIFIFELIISLGHLFHHDLYCQHNNLSKSCIENSHGKYHVLFFFLLVVSDF